VTRSRLIAAGAAIATAAAALLIPSGAGAGSQTNGDLTTTAPDSISVKCNESATSGKLLAGFSLSVTSTGSNTKSALPSGPGVTGATNLAAGQSYAVPADTVLPCDGPLTYTFTGKKNNDTSSGDNTSHSVTVTRVECPSGETCPT
jgi:hypothetical protein